MLILLLFFFFQILSNCDELVGKLCQSLYNSIQLKNKLTEAGVQVKSEDLSLFVEIKDSDFLYSAKKHLQCKCPEKNPNKL